MHKAKNELKELLFPVATFFFIIISWELLDSLFKIKEIILPSPHEIFSAIINNFPYLFRHTSITMLESVIGFIFGSIIGILVGILFVYSKKSRKALFPYAIIIRATPLYALAPILIIWFGNGLLPKIVMATSVAFFPILIGSVKGLSAVEQDQMDLFNSLSASKWQIFRKLRFPNAMAYIFPALKISTTLSVVGATIAEFMGASEGIGFIIVNSSYYLDMSLMFAAILMISVGGVLFFYLIEFIEKKVVFWQVHD